MSRRKNIGARVLKAVSSPLRLRMLTLLLERGPLSYTEIMNLLRLSPIRDAGRFAYHLKQLLKMDLIEPDVETKKYRLTELGRKIVDFADELEEVAYEKRRMLVRTSRLAIEDFDRNKIAESLIKEAGVPVDLAQKIARETEKRLQEIRTKYLTAPLIREFVNAILIERGLEEYRHKLTRLGLPVYDVTNLIKKASSAGLDVDSVHKAAGNAVIGEYTLLNILPRDVADAHLSGALHLNNLGCWVLKPNEFMHDLRFFIRHGLKIEEPGSMLLSRPPPRDLKSALSIAADILRLASMELSGGHTIDFFNIFLSPFISGLNPEEVKEQLRLFMIEVNHAVPREVCLGVEPVIPNFLAESQAFGMNGDPVGTYSDFAEESRLIASALIEVMLEEAKPVVNPRLIVKVRPEALQEEDERLLYEAHRLMAERGNVYFANLSPKGQVFASYTAAGSRFADDWKGDWELDTIRTGSIDSVILNIPRALYESDGDRSVFFENLYDRLEMALRALEIKYLTIRRRVKEGLLPFLAQEKEDPYCRLEAALRLISLVGLEEAVNLLSGKDICEGKEALSLAEEILEYLSKVIRDYAGKRDARYALSLTPNLEASKRLAALDVERYGWAKVKAQGDKNQPFYTHATVVSRVGEIQLGDYLSLEGRFHELTPGGHLAAIPIETSQSDPEELLSITKQIASMHSLRFYTYKVGIIYCSNCQKTFRGSMLKCPVCGSLSAVTHLNHSVHSAL
ncbi:MAG: anaerobic ribonucleoside-triphosphate reductase [Candidatus Bathyarchaeia archaeon]